MASLVPENRLLGYSFLKNVSLQTQTKSFFSCGISAAIKCCV